MPPPKFAYFASMWQLRAWYPRIRWRSGWWLALWTVWMPLSSLAQFPPREDDHFHRRRIGWRIDLQEKRNYPMLRREGPTYDLDKPNETPFKRGIVRSLLQGCQQGRFIAYTPDKFWQTLPWPALESKLRKLNCPQALDPNSLNARMNAEGELAEEADDSFTFGDSPIEGAEPPKPKRTEPADESLAGTPKPNEEPDPCPEKRLYDGTEFILQMIEEAIFDKNKSSLTHDIQWLCLTWIDPEGTRPEEPLACFQYPDVIFLLEETQWKNRPNDAQYRNLREILELRHFTAYAYDISGDRMNTLLEAEHFRRLLVEYEHNLWEY
jgi:hypothetical protein